MDYLDQHNQIPVSGVLKVLLNSQDLKLGFLPGLRGQDF